MGCWQRCAKLAKGNLLLRDAREQVWVDRWRDVVIDQHHKIHRICRKEVLGHEEGVPDKKLALRELGIRLAPVNGASYRALRSPWMFMLMPLAGMTARSLPS